MHPPIIDDHEENLSAEFLKLLPMLALPEGAHITEAGYAYFHMRDRRNTFHCVSCFRQIRADTLKNKEESVSRTFVQKAVCVLSRVPLYGEIRAKLHPTTEAFFAQKDFKDTKILADLYTSSNQFTNCGIKDIAQIYTALNFKQLFELPNFGILSLLKCLMLEGRVVIYSQLSSRTSSFIFSLLAILPGGAFASYCQSDVVLRNMLSLNQFGFPLQLFRQSQLSGK